ncbi:Mesencephalic astrocyte-derived neurotrophic factor [Acropora cervicornis]|uniref:Mesencephalic astrocyte-derived neurotrophic factor homolog n=1 Tax=Acropora cervicornis TaxID=6130 RepID=A0AAD9PTN0_ACRCE|nr:Mesencephalic astrocyte-derived neurotrophic factor [Acropora cervicornis]
MWLFIVLSLNALLSGYVFPGEAALQEGDCEVCIKFLTNFASKLTSKEMSDPGTIQEKLKDACAKAKKKENRFCYYIGGTSDAATGMLGEITKPMSYHKPPEKICERLKTRDSQICELQYDKQIDLKNVDLKKLRVKQLKKILSDWDEECVGCLEKSDFIRRVEQLKTEHSEL